MKRWVKILLGALAAVIALLGLNAIAVTNETRDAERNVEGGELIDTSSGTVQVLEEGDPQGSPIALIHGYTASMNWFEQLGPLLGQNHRVIRVDLLGHGGSDKPSSGYAIADQANAIAEALAKQGVSGATIVGHSLGGSVAAALAEQSPELATAVVILDQAPDDSFENSGFVDKLGYRPLIGPALYRLADVGPDSLVHSQYEVAFAPDFNIASGFENPDQVVDDLREMTYTSFSDTVEAEGDYTDARSLDDRLSAIEVPLLVVFGTEDQVYDAEAAIEPYEDVTGVRTELIEGVGHSPNVESPERAAALIEGFIVATEEAQRAERRARAAALEKQRAKRRAERTAEEAKAEADAKAKRKKQKAPAGK